MTARTPLSALIASAFAMNAAAFDGAADPHFGDNGQVARVRPGNLWTPATARFTGDLGVVADGRFVWTQPLDDGRVWVGRHLHDGTRDITFGPAHDGVAFVPACGDPYGTSMLAAEPGGGVVVWSIHCLVRLGEDGSVDGTFAKGTAPMPDMVGTAFVRDGAGRFVLAGNRGSSSAPIGPEIVRFRADGSVDERFGRQGHVRIDLPGSTTRHDVQAMVVRPDGRILVGGNRAYDAFDCCGLFVAAFDANGAPDPTWNGNGVALIDGTQTDPYLSATALALDRDGSVLISGYSHDFSCCRYVLARLDTRGQVAPSFGVRFFDVDGESSRGVDEERDSLIVLPNRTILIGSAVPDAAADHRTSYHLSRVRADGSVDTRFGHNGGAAYSIADPLGMGASGDYNQLHAVAYDPTDDSALIFGRTNFEDDASGDDFVTLVRARFDLIFGDAFDF